MKGKCCKGVVDGNSNYSERFAALVGPFLSVLEHEWRSSRGMMSLQQRAHFARAHKALGAIHDAIQDGNE